MDQDPTKAWCGLIIILVITSNRSSNENPREQTYDHQKKCVWTNDAGVFVKEIYYKKN